MPMPKMNTIPTAQNRLFDVSVYESSLVKSPAVPDSIFAIIKSVADLAEGQDVISKFCTIKAVDKAKKQVFGYQLVPDIADLQGDIMTAEEVEKTAYGYMKNLAYRAQKGTGTSIEHSVFNGDSYPIVSIIDVDGTIGKAAGLPEDQIRKGGWWIGHQIVTDTTWNKIEKGELTGFSIGGVGKRVPIESGGASSGLKKALDKITSLFGTIQKAEGAVSFQQAYNAKKIREDLWDLFSSLEDSVRSILEDDAITDKQASISITIQQFAQAMAAFVAVYTAGKLQDSNQLLAEAAKSMTELVNKINSNNSIEEGDNNMDEKTLKAFQDKLDALEKTVTEKILPAVTKADPETDDTKPTEATKNAQQNPETDEQALIKRLDDMTASVDAITKRVEKIEKAPGTRNGDDAEGGGDEDVKKSAFKGTALSFTQ